jgi:ATP-dependent Lhr-like helicase
MDHPALARFGPATRAWFGERFVAPSPPQLLGWPAIAEGRHTLIAAATGSGKTLAAFLWCLDQLAAELTAGTAPGGVHTLYVSPLKALSYDIERNLEEPLRGMRSAARRLGLEPPALRVAVRTGDTSPAQRASMLRSPPQILITTPESLFILLSSPRARPLLASVRYLIVDEIHALASNKRGMGLALSLERVAALAAPREPVRIGLSATVRPLEVAARFLAGQTATGDPRAVAIVDAGARKQLELEVSAAAEDFSALPADTRSVWPSLEPRLLELIQAHRSTLLFVRMRAQAERLARALNERAGAPIARAHHSSLARELRRELEEALKGGELRALISTGTMELGIDMAAVELVVQLGSPGSVAAGLQRVGRAGHLVDRASRGRLIALYREDLLEAAVVAGRMLEGRVEALRLPGGGLDVLAQHVLSEAAVEPELTGARLLALARRAAPYAALTRDALDAVLGLLAGRYPAEVARGLSAKLSWERSSDRLAALPGARQLVTTAGGTIPDAGYYALQLANGARLGELEEEFVYERKLGDVISFGTGSWRILEIDGQRVTVAPAPGQPAVVPFWKGGLFGRDPELSVAVGALRRELFARAEDEESAARWLRDRLPLDAIGARGLVRYLADQRRRGRPVGSDRTVVVERFKDDLGDLRIVIHSTFGNRLNAPWALALRRRLRERLGVDPGVLTDDNAILLRLPEGDVVPELDLAALCPPEELEELVLAELGGSALFGTLFRQNAARFLVLGRKGAGKRTPLWLQRLRAKDLLEATAALADFPVRLETYRECLEERMDLPRLRALLEAIRAGEVEVVVEPLGAPSPVASGVLARFMAQYMYEYDEPRAERTLARLQLDRALLDQVLGRADVAELLLPEASAELEAEWQGEGEHARARDPAELLALVQRLVAIPEAELAARCRGEPAALRDPLLADGRLARHAEGWLCLREDLPLLEAARGAGPARAGAQVELCARVLDGLGPAPLARVARRAGLSPADAALALEALERDGRVVRGAFRADLVEPSFCTRANLRQIRRRSIAIARRRVEPVPATCLQALLLRRHGLHGEPRRGEAALAEGLERLALASVPAEALERDLLPARVADYQPAWLDALCADGALEWTGDGERRVRLWPRGLPVPAARHVVLSPDARAIEETLARSGASFLGDLVAASGRAHAVVQRALWELCWAGRARSDRFDALRVGLRAGFEPPAARIERSAARGRLPRLAASALRGGASAWSGRWSLTPEPAAWGEEMLRTLAELLLARHGLLARELVAADGVLSWGALYPLLRQLELTGELRRGLFVAGLGPSQFAPAETVDELRELDRAAMRRAEPEPPTAPLAACDPALVAGALGLPLPAGASGARRPSSYAVLEGGGVVLWIDGAGRSLHLDVAAPRAPLWLAELPRLLARGRRGIRVEEVAGEPALRSPLRGELEALGFRREGDALERRRWS